MRMFLLLTLSIFFVSSLTIIAADTDAVSLPSDKNDDALGILTREWLKSDEEVIKMVESGRYDAKLNAALHQASCSSSRSPKVLDALIKRGANVNSMDESGSYPLHHAAFARNPEAVGLLLDKGANPLLQDKHGWFPLNSAVWQAIQRAPNWVDHREEEYKIKVENVIKIVKILIIKGGNDPSFIYGRKKFSEKSAYSDCGNEDVKQAMSEADVIRLQNLKLSRGQHKFWEDLATNSIKEKAEILIQQYKALVKNHPPESMSIAQFDQNKPLAEQLKKIDQSGVDIGFFWDKNAHFAPIKVGTYCFSLILNNTPKIIGGSPETQFETVVTSSFTFEVRDWSNQHVLLKKVEADEMGEVFKFLLKI
jgi:hypothetical protein